MFSLPYAHVTVKFKLDGKEYEIDDFSIQFEQAIDYKKQPQHEIQGGSMSLTMERTADDNIYTWAKTSILKKNGEITFQTDLGIKVLKIIFENAYCTELVSDINASSGACISLKIDPQRISINGMEHNNYWPE
jgi:hypothetical protein